MNEELSTTSEGHDAAATSPALPLQNDLTAELESVRQDIAFRERVTRLVERDRAVLDRLAR